MGIFKRKNKGDSDKKGELDEYIGKYCEFKIKSDENEIGFIEGTLEDIDYKDGFLLIDSDRGLGCIQISQVVEIKKLID